MVQNVAQPSSGTTLFQPAFSDLVIEAYSRIQVRPPAFTADHMAQARMSANLLMGEWGVKGGPNLWKVALQSVPLQQGVSTYSVPAATVAILDYYVRQFQMATAQSVAVGFTTVMNQATVSVSFPNHGLGVGQWMGIVVPVSVGGLVLLGFYQVTSVTNPNTLVITASSQATSGVVSAGAVPAFTTSNGSTSVTVTLANHGLVAGNNFNVQVSTTVGGITLSGAYTVATYISANQFTFTATTAATSGTSGSENGGLASLQAQNTSLDPNDRVIFPISRSEYSAQPDKLVQAFPTTVWFDRLIQPNLTLWPVPDQNGPYQLYYYAMNQFQDSVLPGGVTLDMPWRFFEAFAAGLAAKLAQKFPPPMPNSFQQLKLLAEEAWRFASEQDTEDVPLYITPGLGHYYRI